MVAASTAACAPDAAVATESDSQELIFPTTRLQPPQLVAPLSSSLVSTRTPTLRWRYPAAGPRSAVIVCRDRACRQVERAYLATGSEVRVTAPLTPGAHFWCVVRYSGLLRSARTSPVWEFRVGARSAPVESASGHYADFNGDGFSDLAVPASQVNGAATQVLVYFGRASGLSSAPDQVLTGPVGYTADLAWFQNTFRLDAGDLNGDGFTDLAVASAGPVRDQVFVYYGGASGLQTTPATTLVGQLPPEGSLSDGFQSEFGVAMTPAGDVNGDGYADLAITEIGRREGPRGAGFVQVYQGGARGIAATPTLTLGPSYEGGRVTEGLELDVGFRLVSGDLNADGLGDLVASTDVPVRVQNTLRVFDGASAGPSYAAQTVLRNPTEFGQPGPMALGLGAGDVNGDGYGDAVTSLSGSGGSFPQHTYLTFAGGAEGVSLTPASSVLVTPATFFPRADLVAGGGDVNGDGYGDVVVRAGDASLLTLRGGAAGLALPDDGGRLPVAGATASVLARATLEHDFNNDGYADLHYGDHVHLGSAAGLALAPSVTLVP